MRLVWLCLFVVINPGNPCFDSHFGLKLEVPVFRLCFVATMLARPLHQERLQIMRSNQEAQKRLAPRHSRNGPWTLWQTHTHSSKEPSHPGGVSLLSGFQIKNPVAEDLKKHPQIGSPWRTTPKNWSILGVVLHVTGDVWGPCQMDHRWEV